MLNSQMKYSSSTMSFCLFKHYLFAIFLIYSAISKPLMAANSVEFNPKRGFFDKSFHLNLSTKEGSIRYTLDGSKPTQSNGHDYKGSIFIEGNAIVRAYACNEDSHDAKINTHSYIFPEKVIHQKNNMMKDYGYDFSKEQTGKVFWSEEMDPEIVNAKEYKNEIVQALKHIPTLSIVMKKEDLWGENGIHWGSNLEKKGNAFERECSIEMIYAEGYKENKFDSWQENAGIKIQGGGGRWKKGTSDHKQSFTIAFKKKYGAGKLKHEIFADAPHGTESTAGKYDKIILRAGHNKNWAKTPDKSTVYVRDQLGRDLQILMSGFGSHGTFVHLYLNGKYWGLYNPCEKPDHHFLANHLGGNADNYFYAKGKDNRASDGRKGEPGQNKSHFYEATTKDYCRIPFKEMQNWVKVDQSIACFLLYGYANPGDGPQYYYGNCNEPKGPVVWIPWDIEDSFEGGSKRTGPPSVENMIDSKKSGDNGFTAFWKNADFRMRFNDLVYQHFFNDGAMTDENVTAAWDNLTNYINTAIICESARWGDEKSSNPKDRDNEWNTARNAVRNDFKGKADDFISKLREAGYFSELEAPKFFIDNKEYFKSVINTKKKLDISICSEGTNGIVYYTTDGTDPRTWDLKGDISANSKKINHSSNTLTIKKSTTIKARTLNNYTWSPLHVINVVWD